MIEVRGPLFVGGKEIEAGTAFFFVNVDLHQDVGRMAVIYNKDQVMVGTVYVEEDFRRKGLSTRLHDAAFNWAQRTGRMLLSGVINSPENQQYWDRLTAQGLAEKVKVDKDEMFVRI